MRKPSIDYEPETEEERELMEDLDAWFNRPIVKEERRESTRTVTRLESVKQKFLKMVKG